jgi:exodeoxyribonuclease VII large subunit
MAGTLKSRAERLRWLTGRAAQVSPAARLAQQSQRLDDLEQRMVRSMRHSLAVRYSALAEHRSRLWRASPAARVHGTLTRHAALQARLAAAMQMRLRRSRERLLPLLSTLQAVSPLATLARGYAIVSNAEGAILRDATDASPGMRIEAQLANGRIRATVDP